MTPKEALALSGRSETWLRNHQCNWCGATLWMALRSGCRAMGEKCDPSKKNFGPDAMARPTPRHPALLTEADIAALCGGRGRRS
jgi:hypothetical protein